VPDAEEVFSEHPEARHVLELAHSWARVATGKQRAGQTETLRFTAAWIGFNALYSLASATQGEFDRIRSFSSRADVESLHEHLLRSNRKYSLAVEALALSPVFNHWRSEWVSITNPGRMQQVLEVCYAIRGNLVHGHKSPESERDLHLVGAAYRVILPLVIHFAKPLNFFGSSDFRVAENSGLRA